MCKKIKEGPKELKSFPDQYLRWYAKPKTDIDQIRRLCCEASLKIRWGNIPNADKKTLTDFFQIDYNQKNKQTTTSIWQLKILLVEYALRCILAERAAGVLLEKAKELFNQESAFQALSGSTGVWQVKGGIFKLH